MSRNQETFERSLLKKEDQFTMKNGLKRKVWSKEDCKYGNSIWRRVQISRNIKKKTTYHIKRRNCFNSEIKSSFTVRNNKKSYACRDEILNHLRKYYHKNPSLISENKEKKMSSVNYKPMKSRLLWQWVLY